MAENWTGSEYEVDEIGFKFEGEENYTAVECIGSLEEEMDVKTVVKNCRGVPRKKRARGLGTGTLKLSAHIPWAVYVKFYGMELDTLIAGVKAYGKNSIHKGFAMTAHVIDEDGNKKLKAYPNALVTAGGVARKIENGAEEVAELELEISVMPDEYGNGLYDAPVGDITDEKVKTDWMTAFTPEMVQLASA